MHSANTSMRQEQQLLVQQPLWLPLCQALQQAHPVAGTGSGSAHSLTISCCSLLRMCAGGVCLEGVQQAEGPQD
jgi:hypothetical protein